MEQPKCLTITKRPNEFKDSDRLKIEPFEIDTSGLIEIIKIRSYGRATFGIPLEKRNKVWS